MKISPNLRILTIGDGDLSFSRSLLTHHQPQKLCATVFDTKQELARKYGLTNYAALNDKDVTVLTEFDVTDAVSWEGLPKQSFDLVIFQFPLIPNDVSQHNFEQSSVLGDQNLRHRHLLYLFLRHAMTHFLDTSGERLAVISSKDCKPYRQWDIEHALPQAFDMHGGNNQTLEYLGRSDFNAVDFPGYDIRNVDRDKFVKQTQGISYYYSDKQHGELRKTLVKSAYTLNINDPQYCAMCRVGPMLTQVDIDAHQQSKRHNQMNEFNQRWRHHVESNIT